MLTDEMRKLIAEQRLGYVASVGADGSPNLSPTGTFVVLDERRIGFGEIRSPQTMRNLAANNRVEVNFVDPFSRKGFRFKGVTEVVPRGAPAFDDLLQRVAGTWQALAEKVRAVVVIHVERALPLVTPAYDVGSTEPELRAHWARHFRSIQPGGRFADEA
jgi:predicted pyridoxine 5'-phosphate oxidase superfamily flavin-nucleotide-binding protein